MKASRAGIDEILACRATASAASMSRARFSASAWLGQLRPQTSLSPREEKLSTTSAT